MARKFAEITKTKNKSILVNSFKKLRIRLVVIEKINGRQPFTSRNPKVARGNSWSILLMSAVNRFVILPMGFRSKNRIFVSRMDFSIFSYILFEAIRQNRKNSVERKIVKKNAELIITSRNYTKNINDEEKQMVDLNTSINDGIFESLLKEVSC
jgi:hypothetical protein